MIYQSTLDAICTAPILRVTQLFPSYQVWIKTDTTHYSADSNNNISDRIAWYVINRAKQTLELQNNSIIVVPLTKSCMGFAKIGAMHNFQVLFVAPKNLSSEHAKIVQDYGADVVFSPADKGMKGAVQTAITLATHNADMWCPTVTHRRLYFSSLIKEVQFDFPNSLDFIVIPSISNKLTNIFAYNYKRVSPSTKIYAATTREDLVSPPHSTSTKKSRFLAKNEHTKYLDGIITVSKNRAQQIANLLPLKEGLSYHFTSGVALSATEKLITHLSIKTSNTVLAFQIGI